MQSFIAIFLAYTFAVVFVSAVPIPQPQLGSLPLSNTTGSAAGPAAIAENVVSTVEGLIPDGGALKRQLGEVTSIVSDPTSIISTVESIPEGVLGGVGGLGGGDGPASGLLKRQLSDVEGLVSNPTAIVSDVVSTVEGLAGGLGGGLPLPRRQLGGIDAAAIVPSVLQGLDLGPVGSIVANVEGEVENAAGGL